MKAWLAMGCLLLAPLCGFAGGPESDTETMLTMRVDGEVVVDVDGRVQEYEITTDIPDRLRSLVDEAVHGWIFKPTTVDGEPVQVRKTMRVTLATREAGTDHVITVDNVTFRPSTTPVAGQPKVERKRSVEISGKTMGPPEYPNWLKWDRVEAAVLLYARVTPEGRVDDAVIVQSSLFNVAGRPSLLEDAREAFEASALAAARNWEFDVEMRPGAKQTPMAMTVTVPLWYVIEGRTGHDAGKWRLELRGAKHQVPWLAEARDAQAFGVSDLEPGDRMALASTLQPPEGVIGRAL